MKSIQYLLMSFVLLGLLSGCDFDENNTQTFNTQFASDVQTVLAQSEDSEPLEITDTPDDSTSFDSLL